VAQVPMVLPATQAQQDGYEKNRLSAQTIDSKVLSRIYGHGRGWAFTPSHFRGLGSGAAIDSSLRRLTAAGTIRARSHWRDGPLTTLASNT
jgi:hypothetical protein